MGKTSEASPFNIPGRIAWMAMECPGFLTLLYIMRTLPAQHGITDLPWQNLVLAGLFVIHYLNRAVIFPLIQPSMAPIHISVAAMAMGFQVCNATSIASWLAAYGPVTAEAWKSQSSVPQFALGLLVFYAGLAGNYFHDEELREIRRREQRRQDKIREEQVKNGDSVDAHAPITKHYAIPEAGLFRYMLFPHYFCEWVEWLGFWMAAGLSCTPARAFFINEVFSMLPRAVNGKAWYIAKFGEDKVGKKWAVIPGVI